MADSLAGSLIGLGVAFTLAAALTNPFWQDPEGATQTLENAGYENIETGGYGWFDCGKGDLWHTKFKVENQNGKEVTGTVCKGVFKGSTIRFD